MGTVVLAKDNLLNRHVAIKSIHPHLLSSPNTLQRFLTEARATAALSHPNIVAIFDIDENQSPSFILEYIEGPTLDVLIQKGGTFPNQVILELLRQIASGLKAAHHAGIVHRDIKPSNIFINNEGRVKIGDFGVAHTLQQEQLTISGSIMGTPQYVSPESIQTKTISGKADLFALGIIGYQMATMLSPFRGETPHQAIQKIVEHHPAPPSKCNSGILPGVSQLIEDLIEKKADKRPDAITVMKHIDDMAQKYSFQLSPAIIQTFLQDGAIDVEKEKKLLFEHYRQAALSAHSAGQAVKAQRLLHLAGQYGSEKDKTGLSQLLKPKKRITHPVRWITAGVFSCLFLVFLVLALFRSFSSEYPIQNSIAPQKPSAQNAVVSSDSVDISSQKSDSLVQSMRKPPSEPEKGPKKQLQKKIRPDLKKPAIAMASGSSKVGFVLIKTRPPFAKILWQNRVVALSPMKKPLKLPTGRHTIRVLKDGCIPMQRMITIDGNDTLKLALQLQRKP